MKLYPNKILRKLSYSLLMSLWETHTVSETPNPQGWRGGDPVRVVQEVNTP